MAHSEKYERGEILRTLSNHNGGASSCGLALLRRALDNVGISLSINDLKLRLVYLEGKEYVQCYRRKDIPAYAEKLDQPGGGRSDDIVTARLTPKGIDLVEGNHRRFGHRGRI